MALLLLLPACKSKGTNAVTSETPTPALTQAAVSPTVSHSPSPSKSPSPSTSPSPSKSPTPKKSGVTATATPSVTPTVQISEASGATKTIRVGIPMTLRLGLQDATAMWTFKSHPDATILVISNESSSPPSTPPAAGAAGGSHRWVFRGVAPGQTSFTLNETEPGAGAPVISTYSLTVVVTS